MRRSIALLALLFLSACTQEPEKIKGILTADGYTNVTVGGYAVWSCGEKDTFANTFVGDKNGMRVKGVVCGGVLKNNTIRVESATPIRP